VEALRCLKLGSTPGRRLFVLSLPAVHLPVTAHGQWLSTAAMSKQRNLPYQSHALPRALLAGVAGTAMYVKVPVGGGLPRGAWIYAGGSGDHHRKEVPGFSRRPILVVAGGAAFGVGWRLSSGARDETGKFYFR